MSISIDFEHHERMIRHTQAAFGELLFRAGIEAVPAMSAFVSQLMLNKLSDSEIGKNPRGYKSTGNLRRAIAATDVQIWLGYGNPRMIMRMGFGGDYEGRSNVYQIYSALSYGAVRGTGASRTYRSKIKKAALKGETTSGKVGAKKKRRKLLFRGVESQTTGATKAGSLVVKGRRAIDEENIVTERIIVTKPFDFWQLTAGDIGKIQGRLNEVLTEIIRKRR